MHQGTAIVTDIVTLDGLTTFIEKKLGGKHHRFKRGYKNVIDEDIHPVPQIFPRFASNVSSDFRLCQSYVRALGDSCRSGDCKNLVFQVVSTHWMKLDLFRDIMSFSEMKSTTFAAFNGGTYSEIKI